MSVPHTIAHARSTIRNASTAHHTAYAMPVLDIALTERTFETRKTLQTPHNSQSLINPNQPESTPINPHQPSSTLINPNQP
eukprot:3933957-Rhodomonas_salina.1